MRDRILLAVAFGAALAASARAQSAYVPDAGAGAGAVPPRPPPQIVVVPEPPPPPPPQQQPPPPPPQVISQSGDGGTVTVVVDVPTTADGGTAVAGGPGEPDAGEGEQIILLVPKKPPPPPEPPRQIRVTVMHQPRPRVEWGQSFLELGASTGVFMVGSAGLFAVELVPIIISELIGARPVSNGMLNAFSVANAVILPLATTITIERVKAYSRHYTLEGLGWWATLGTGLVMQAISAALTIATLDVDSYLIAPHLVVFGALTPLSQTVVANVLTTPRDPLAPIEGMSRTPVLLDGNGRPVRFVRLLSISF